MGRKLFIFDCFGVVISDVSTLMETYLTDEQKRYMRESVYRKLDTGAIGMEEMYEAFSSLCNLPVDTVKREWASRERVLTDTIEVIKALKNQGHCIALLSNAAVSYIDYLFAKYDLFKYFDRLFVSAKYGCAKPDKEFYKLCVDSFDEPFDNVYFTDDNPNNLKDLHQFGIAPILFKNAKDFAEKIGVYTAF